MKLGGKGKTLKEQLAEQKKKEAELIKKIEKEEEQERKEKELQEQLAKEKKLLEEKEAREAHLKAETEKAKENERKQQAHAKLEAEKAKLKEELKDHPDKCFCPKCDELRNLSIDNTRNVNGKEIEITESFDSVEDAIESTLDNKPKKEKKLPKFKKPKFSGFKLPKREPKPEVLKKDDLEKYHKVKKNPNALVSFIKDQREKLNQSKVEKLKPVEGAIDTKIQPSIFTDLTVLGIRLAIGFSFIAHGLSKMNEDGLEFGAMLTHWGMPPELALPIAYIELLAGLFITVGLLTRISSIVIGVIMLGAIFAVKGASTLIGVGGVELDVIILASVSLLGVFGPGRLSLANIGIKGMIFDRKLQ